MCFLCSKKTVLSLFFVLFSVGACQSDDRTGASPENRPELRVADKTNAALAKTHSQRMRFPVSGMVCEGCENSIRGAVEKLDGVVAYTASHTAKKAVIDYDPSKISPERLSQTIAKLGYEVGQGAKVGKASEDAPAPSPAPAPASASSPN